MNLEKIGNIRQGYENPQRKVINFGILESSKLALKLYDMYTIKPSEDCNKKDVRNFLIKNIQSGIVLPRTGLGFAILSEDMLNVATWNVTYPIVPNNILFEFPGEGRKISEAQQVDINNSGAFCLWEARIVNHEGKAWERYLSSKKTTEDKKNYLNDVIEGDL